MLCNCDIMSMLNLVWIVNEMTSSSFRKDFELSVSDSDEQENTRKRLFKMCSIMFLKFDNSGNAVL